MNYKLNIYHTKEKGKKELINTFENSNNEIVFEKLYQCFRDANPKTREGKCERCKFYRFPYEEKHYKFTFWYNVNNDGILTIYEYEFKQ